MTETEDPDGCPRDGGSRRCVCVRACVRGFVRACVRACVRSCACVCLCGCVVYCGLMWCNLYDVLGFYSVYLLNYCDLTFGMDGLVKCSVTINDRTVIWFNSHFSDD